MRIILLLILFIGLSGCGPMSIAPNLDNATSLNSEEESVFVIGSPNDNYWILIHPGNMDEKGFEQNSFRNAVLAGFPKNGYWVGKAKAGETVAITRIKPMQDKESGLEFSYGSNYGTCEGNKTVVFNVPKGKVIYLTDIRFENKGDHIEPKYTQDYNAAKKHINNNYSNLKDRLEVWDYQLIPMNRSCTETIYYFPPTY